MLLTLSFCNLAWWQVLLSWLLPFLLGWWFSRLLAASFGKSNEVNHDRCNETIANLRHELDDSRKYAIDLEHESTVLKAIDSDLKFSLSNLSNSDSSSNDSLLELQNIKTKLAEADLALQECRQNLNLCEEEKTNLKLKLGFLENESIGYQDKTAHTAFTSNKLSLLNDQIPSSVFSSLKNDNLQIIEGIGPKMDELLKSFGLSTWSDIANADALDIKKKLEDANSKYRIIDPSSWPEQAKLANEQKWDKLIEYQKSLSSGKEGSESETNSKLESILIKLGLIKKFALDDLKAIEGIGPKIEGLLNSAGIKTWRELADSSVEVLRQILDNAGESYQLADPSTWAKQADMAARGDWKSFFEYQDKLQGGKEV